MFLNFLNMLAESFDLPVLDWIAANLYCDFLDVAMPIITMFGDDGIFWIAVALILMATKKYRKAGFAMGAAMMIGLLVCNVTLKPLVGRIRPYDYQWEVFGKEILLLTERMHDYSFPSGHTIASFEACTALMIHDKKLGIPATVLAVLIGFSRLYLYLHYPTDVLFSIAAGIAIAYLGNWLVNKAYEKFAARKAK